MIGVPDAASVATMQFLTSTFGIDAGPSTGTNVFGALRLACEMVDRGRSGSIVTLMCDRADRYSDTFGDDGWLATQGMDPTPFAAEVAASWRSLGGA